MNILFGAVLLIILLLPGILFRLGYLALPFSSKGFRTSFLEELLISLVPAVIIQICAYLVTDVWICGVDEASIYALLTNQATGFIHQEARASIGLFLIYFLVTGTIAFFLGALLRGISIQRGLHLKYKFLRVFNEWEIYFEGYVLDYPHVPGRQGDIVERWLDVLVSTGEGSYLYSGMLRDYVITRDETLDRIYLLFVRRRKLSNDRKDGENDLLAGVSEPVGFRDDEEGSEAMDDEWIDDRYYFMPGDFFMIPGSEIKNINIRYYSAQVTDVAP